MLTLQDAQELVKKPESARELAQAMIPDKISKILEKNIDHAVIAAIAQGKTKVSLTLNGRAKEKHDDIITYVYLLGMLQPKIDVQSWQSFDESGVNTEIHFDLQKNIQD